MTKTNVVTVPTKTVSNFHDAIVELRNTGYYWNLTERIPALFKKYCETDSEKERFVQTIDGCLPLWLEEIENTEKSTMRKILQTTPGEQWIEKHREGEKKLFLFRLQETLRFYPGFSDTLLPLFQFEKALQN
jgi:hypothetical protein